MLETQDIKNEVMEEVEGEVMENNKNELEVINEFNSLQKTSTNCQRFSTITDVKKAYNLQNKDADVLINDIVDQEIEVRDVIVKRYQKPLEEPIVNEQTGEIEKEFETTMSVLLIDEDGKTYATGSKTFGYQLMGLCRDFGPMLKEGFRIRIIKKKAMNSNNKALGFELV